MYGTFVHVVTGDGIPLGVYPDQETALRSVRMTVPDVRELYRDENVATLIGESHEYGIVAVRATSGANRLHD